MESDGNAEGAVRRLAQQDEPVVAEFRHEVLRAGQLGCGRPDLVTVRRGRGHRSPGTTCG